METIIMGLYRVWGFGLEFRDQGFGFGVYGCSLGFGAWDLVRV